MPTVCYSEWVVLGCAIMFKIPRLCFWMQNYSSWVQVRLGLAAYKAIPTLPCNIRLSHQNKRLCIHYFQCREVMLTYKVRVRVKISTEWRNSSESPAYRIVMYHMGENQVTAQSYSEATTLTLSLLLALSLTLNYTPSRHCCIRAAS